MNSMRLGDRRRGDRVGVVDPPPFYVPGRVRVSVAFRVCAEGRGAAEPRGTSRRRYFKSSRATLAWPVCARSPRCLYVWRRPPKPSSVIRTNWPKNRLLAWFASAVRLVFPATSSGWRRAGITCSAGAWLAPTWRSTRNRGEPNPNPNCFLRQVRQAGMEPHAPSNCALAASAASRTYSAMSSWTRAEPSSRHLGLRRRNVARLCGCCGSPLGRFPRTMRPTPLRPRATR